MYGPLKSFCQFWTSDVKDHKRGLAITTALVLLGYAGAASYYAYLLGFNIRHEWACPVCLHITSFGEPRDKFIGRTIGLGTVNALLFLLLGRLLIGLLKIVRHFRSTQI